jgi:hypothetical protein
MSNSDGNNSENNMGGFEDSFTVMLTRVTNKMIANGVRSAGAFRDRAQELKNFIDAANPDAPFDSFSAADLGAELYNDVKNMLREVLIRFPRNIDREGYKDLISLVFNQAIRRHRTAHPGNMQNGGRRRTRRRGLRKQRNTRRSRR